VRTRKCSHLCVLRVGRGILKELLAKPDKREFIRTEATSEKAWDAFARGCSSLERNLYRIRRILVAQ